MSFSNFTSNKIEAKERRLSYFLLSLVTRDPLPVPAWKYENGLFHKKIQTGGKWGHGISMGIEEIGCGKSRGHVKKCSSRWNGTFALARWRYLCRIWRRNSETI